MTSYLSLDEVTAYCEKNGYHGDQFVFKLANHWFGGLEGKPFQGKCEKLFIVMEKLPDTVTNETRKDVRDPKYAKFRGNEFKVRDILCLNQGTQIVSFVNRTQCFKDTVYTVNQIVVPDKWDNDLDNVCAPGIHYFKSIEGAYSYGPDASYFYGLFDCPIPVLGYTGIMRHYYENGGKRCEGIFVNGNCVSVSLHEWKDSDQSDTETDVLAQTQTHGVRKYGHIALLGLSLSIGLSIVLKFGKMI